MPIGLAGEFIGRKIGEQKARQVLGQLPVDSPVRKALEMYTIWWIIYTFRKGELGLALLHNRIEKERNDAKDKNLDSVKTSIPDLDQNSIPPSFPRTNEDFTRSKRRTNQYGDEI